ncbi:uncharacterized protein LOC123443499 isoform X2 [Hordeum vulgare subsp. vulgare]|uniref:Complex I assembly factor TIMMDC1, mitochondrial n=1 Tax=Hordeum vulgare subsp. vulgare TaxID=112509 RepID=A0A8I6XTF1_HORVV|nr:uncharacterized protein LOC123443499 isoform X2 [Hordeum vulgare subsp. vulgare]
MPTQAAPTPPPAEPLPSSSDSTSPTEDAEADAEGTPSRSGPVGTVSWGTGTLVGVFTGLLYGGAKEANANVSKDAEVMLKMGSTTDKREQYRLMRDAMEKRFIRVAKGSLVGGARLGMFTATFFGIQNLLIENRGVHDVFNIAGAGSATAAAFGLICWVQLKLAEKANLEIENSKSSSDLQGNQSRVGAAIDRLESSLRK